MECRDFWNRYLKVYDTLEQVSDYREYLEDVVGQLDLSPGQHVLDAGSGTGNLSARLRNLSVRVTSLDFSPVALRAHLRKFPGSEVIQSSLESPLPFPDRTFDRIACLSVLFCLSGEATSLALREFRRVLRPGGRLIVTAMRPGRSKLRAFAGHLVRRGAFGARHGPRGPLRPMLAAMYYNVRMYLLSRQHGYRRFSRDDLLREIENAGLRSLSCQVTYGGYFHLVKSHVPSQPARTTGEGPSHARATCAPQTAEA